LAVGESQTIPTRYFTEQNMDTITAVESYLAGPENLRAAVAGMGREQVVARPIPGRWSVLEVVCHLADTDANIAHRVKRVLSEERPTFERVQPDLMRATLAYHSRDVEEELAYFDLGRRQIARILNASPLEAWERVGVVGDRGEKTVGQMVNGAIEHVAHHLKFILEKRDALRIDEIQS
jgi:uncharacterized damage-inducible protein DinB